MKKWMNFALLRQEISLFWGHPPAWLWLVLLMAYLFSSLKFYADFAASFNLGLSVWEIIVLAIDPYVTTFGFATVFLVLVFMAERKDTLRTLYVYRLRSRNQWFATKIVSLFINALVYSLLSFIILVGSAAVFGEFETGWSSSVVEAARTMAQPDVRPHPVLGTAVENMASLQPYSPEQLIAGAFFFCLLGTMMVGLLFHTTLLAVSRPILALAGMIFYTNGSLLIAYGTVTGWFTVLFPQPHIMPKIYTLTEKSILDSLLICVPILLVLYLISWQLIKRKKITV